MGGAQLHEWVFVARDPGDASFITRGDEGVGATIMGRNMFGPIRGDWGPNGWTGWWGDEPPYHHPV